jgi:hypothetical protein
MQRSSRSLQASALFAVLVAAALVAAFALPVAGQDPTSSPAASAKPGGGPKTDKPGKGPKTEKGPKVAEVPVSLTGRVGTRTDADGDTAYTLIVGATVYQLHVGPPWWWGDKHPLKDLVGDTVSVTGEGAQGSTDVDVLTVDGKTVREPGRPPWAGGWKAVGERHPGWAQWKIDKHAAKAAGKGHGRPPWAGPKDTPDDAD